MRNFLSRNLGLKILSLLIALLLFSAAPGNKNVKRHEIFTVPLQVVGEDNLAEKDLILAKAAPDTVKVTLQGTIEGLQNMKTQDLQASIDLAEVESAGPKSLPVRVTGIVPDVGLEQDITVDVSVDHLLNKTVPVEVSFPEQVQGEYDKRYVVGSIDKAFLSGPASVVNTIAQGMVLVTDNFLQGGTEGYFKKSLEIQWVDDQRRPVNAETVKTNAQFMDVTIYPEKTVPIHVNLVGDVAEGYRIVSTLAVPDTVTISGEPQALAQIDQMETLTVDVSGLAVDKKQMVAFRDCQGIYIGKGQPASVEVLIEVEQMAVRTFDITEIEPINVPDGMEATVQDEMVTVTLRGVASVLDTITESMLYVEVDMTEARMWTHKYTVSMRDVPEGVEEVSIDPTSVSVRVISS